MRRILWPCGVSVSASFLLGGEYRRTSSVVSSAILASRICEPGGKERVAML